MRHTEFWSRLEAVLGQAYAVPWAGQFAIGDLDSRTAREALDSGIPPRQVWDAVARVLELPAHQR